MWRGARYSPGLSRGRLAAIAAAHVVLAALLAWAIAAGAGFPAHAAAHVLLAVPLALVVAPLLWNPRGEGRGVRLILGAALLARIPFLLSPPTLSGDLYRVIWEGRVIAAGHDPWTEPPDHPALAELRDEFPEIRERVAYWKLPAIYPPLAQWFGYAATGLTTDARALKGALVGLEALLVLGLWLLLRSGGLNPLLLTMWLWNPLVLTEIAGSGHLDVLGVGLLAFAVLAAERSRAVPAAVLAALSGLAKLAGFAVLPLLLRRAGSVRAVAAAAVAVVAATLTLPGAARPLARLGELTGSLTHFARHWRFNEGLYLGVEALAGELARPVVALLLLALLVTLMSRRPNPSLGALWLAGSAFLLSPVAHPWYLLWALAFAPLHPERRALVAAALTLSVTAVFSYGPFWMTPPGGEWALSPGLRLAEYLPPLAVATVVALWFDRHPPHFLQSRRAKRNRIS